QNGCRVGTLENLIDRAPRRHLDRLVRGGHACPPLDAPSKAPAKPGQQRQQGWRIAMANPEPDIGNSPETAIDLLDMIWPETGLQTPSGIPRRPKDTLSEVDTLELTIDFVTLSLTPLEFIQLASFLRMSIDDLLDHHPSLQRAVINAFDIRE